MKRNLKTWLGCLVLLAGAISAQQHSRIPGLGQEVSRLLNWKWFWTGQIGSKSYAPGEVVNMAIVDSPEETAVFIASIGVAMEFQVHDGRIIRDSIRNIADTSNDSAVDRYISNYGTIPGFAFRPGESPATSRVPVHRENLTIQQKQELLKQRSISFTLPILRTPDYIRSRRMPPDIGRLDTAVRNSVRAFWGPSCGRGEIVIPFYSLEDPVIYVYADLGACDKGVIGFSHGQNGDWASGQLSLAKPPNRWSFTIQRIRDNSAVVIPLPLSTN